jgi:hypothetical protein
VCPDPRAVASVVSLPSTEQIVAERGAQIVLPLSALVYNCDAAEWLKAVVTFVTRNDTSGLEKGMTWTTWIQNTIIHSCLPPIDEQLQAIYHPVYLLQDRRMHCGQNNRLVVDGLIAIGIPARLLQMHGHVGAEFFADGRWIFAETDILNRGQFLRDNKGQVVGIDEVTKDNSILRSVTPYQETSCSFLLDPKQRANIIDFAENFRNWTSVFDGVTYGDSSRGSLSTPFVIKKTATAEQLAASHYYGWNYYEFCDRTDPECSN